MIKRDVSARIMKKKTNVQRWIRNVQRWNEKLEDLEKIMVARVTVSGENMWPNQRKGASTDQKKGQVPKIREKGQVSRNRTERVKCLEMKKNASKEKIRSKKKFGSKRIP